MTRETKVGLVLAGSFLTLVGVVVAARMRKAEDSTHEPVAQAVSPAHESETVRPHDQETEHEKSKGKPPELVRAVHQEKEEKKHEGPTAPPPAQPIVSDPGPLAVPDLKPGKVAEDDQEQKLKALAEAMKGTKPPMLPGQPIDPPMTTPESVVKNDAPSPPALPPSKDPAKESGIQLPNFPETTPPPPKSTETSVPSHDSTKDHKKGPETAPLPFPPGADSTPPSPALPGPMPVTPMPLSPMPLNPTPPEPTPPGPTPIPMLIKDGKNTEPVQIGTIIPPTPQEPNHAPKDPAPAPVGAFPIPKNDFSAVPPVGAEPKVSSPPITIGTSTLPKVRAYDVVTHVSPPEDTTFAAVSQRYYHSDKYTDALLQFNREHFLGKQELGPNPLQIRPGQKVFVPPADILETKYANLIGNRNQPAPLTPPIGITQPTGSSFNGQNPLIGRPTGLAPVPTPTPTKDKTIAYQVRQPSQMILEIARDALGDTSRWGEIYRLNNELRPQEPIPGGTVIQLPATAKVP